jgi:hypothetical protein
MKILTWLRASANNPVESIVFICALGLFVFAIYLAIPQASLEHIASPITQNFAVQVQAWFIAGVMFLCSLPGLLFPLFKGAVRTKTLKLASFCLFATFFFLSVLRVMTFGWIPLNWVTTLMISLINGVARLFWEGKKT